MIKWVGIGFVVMAVSSSIAIADELTVPTKTQHYMSSSSSAAPPREGEAVKAAAAGESRPQRKTDHTGSM
jgi:hypothetical protein